MRRSLRLAIEVLKAGTAAAFIMPLVGTMTKPFLGPHVWQHGKKVADLYVEDPSPALLFAQEMIWCWAAALLVILLQIRLKSWAPVLSGIAFGITYWALVSTFALPLYFGDAMPWERSLSNLIQPLLVLVSFGASVGIISRRFVQSVRREELSL